MVQVTTGANACVILTKRVRMTGDSAAETGSVQLFNKYFCAGEASSNGVYETWSSSKIFAMANAAGHLRTNESCCTQSTFGMDSSTTGKSGKIPLGDLATIICSYDHTAGYSSNSLSSYFHDLGFRDRIHNLVSSGDWLGLQNLTLGESIKICLSGRVTDGHTLPIRRDI
jgi:hypothetical protein